MADQDPYTARQWATWRAALGYSLTDAAAALGIGRRYYIRLEQGEKVGSLTLTLLAIALDSLRRNRPL